MVKGFSNRNALERILIYECIGKGFTIEIGKGFYNRNTGKGFFHIGMHRKGFKWNALERVLQ